MAGHKPTRRRNRLRSPFFVHFLCRAGVWLSDVDSCWRVLLVRTLRAHKILPGPLGAYNLQLVRACPLYLRLSLSTCATLQHNLGRCKTLWHARSVRRRRRSRQRTRPSTACNPNGTLIICRGKYDRSLRVVSSTFDCSVPSLASARYTAHTQMHTKALCALVTSASLLCIVRKFLRRILMMPCWWFRRGINWTLGCCRDWCLTPIQ